MRNTPETHPVLELLSRWERRAWEPLFRLSGPGAACPPTPATIAEDLSDPPEREASRALLRAIAEARQRRLASDSPKAGRPRVTDGDDPTRAQ